MARGAADECAGAGGLAECQILLREPERSRGIAADGEPEFRGMIGERLRVTREQFVIAGFRLATPGLRLLGLTGVAQDAGELRRVIGIVGCERQRPKRAMAAAVSPRAASSSARWPCAGT